MSTLKEMAFEYKQAAAKLAMAIERHKVAGDLTEAELKSLRQALRETREAAHVLSGYSMKWLQSLRAIVIDPDRCPDTAREFSEYEYERDDKTGEVVAGYPDAANHHIDAVRYGTNRIWKRRGR